MSSPKRSTNLQLVKKDLTEITSNPLVIKIIQKWAIALGKAFSLLKLNQSNFKSYLGCWIIISLMGNIIQLTVQYGIFDKTYTPTRDYFVSVAFLMAISMTSSVQHISIIETYF